MLMLMRYLPRVLFSIIYLSIYRRAPRREAFRARVSAPRIQTRVAARGRKAVAHRAGGEPRRDVSPRRRARDVPRGVLAKPRARSLRSPPRVVARVGVGVFVLLAGGVSVFVAASQQVFRVRAGHLRELVHRVL
eukprot:31410-Pelagococcus_subviridis.AAC.1